MQGEATKGEPTSPGGGALSSVNTIPRLQPRNGDHEPKFIPVRDSRNRRVPSLYQRNGRFYAQLWIDRGFGKKSARRFALFTSDNSPVRTLEEAKEALEKATVRRKREGTSQLCGQCRANRFFDRGQRNSDRVKTGTTQS